MNEHYCVQPQCDCKEALLSFLKLQDASGTRSKSLKNAPAVRYNYRNGAAGKVFPGAAADRPPAVLLAALKSAHPYLNQDLEVRHLLMQGVYLRSYLAVAKPKPRSRLAGAAVAAESNKVGRNDPCPCGSGKKYKQCCLRDKTRSL